MNDLGEEVLPKGKKYAQKMLNAVEILLISKKVNDLLMQLTKWLMI
jgi:hypothetical protein